MYVSGIARTKFGTLAADLPELAYDAMCRALEDGRKSISDINAIFVSSFLCGPLNRQLHLNSVVASLLPGIHIPIIRIESACASSSAAFNQALCSLNAFDTVMVVGAEKMTSSNSLDQTAAIAMASDRSLDQQEGLNFPAGFALVAQQYMRKYKTSHEILEQISFINHENANSNPLAHFFHKRVTMDMIKNSPMIASPLNLFDCSPISDGAAAIVLSREKRTVRDVRVVSAQFATDSISIAQRTDLTSFEATKIAARKAYDQAHIRPKVIDALELHDCFTISELIALEDLGFCSKGEAAKLVREGSILNGGALPVNTDGGLIGSGHPIGATGLAQIFEIVTQLREEAGSRQLERVHTGMTHNIGGTGGSAAVTILSRC